ncbi:MAG: bile acid:Na+ symporter, family [Patescibacteria group bacterium]|nr:bile acid:Na+ symporter, family [Patescibacteria group bacterium]
MNNIRQIISSIFHSYLFVALAAILLGVFLPNIFKQLSPYTTVFLGIIFFLSSLKIDVSNLKREVKDWKVISWVCIFILFITPGIIYFLTLKLYAPLALAFLLLSVMPAGMTSPLLSEFIGGRQSLALVLTMLTSLLAPLTVPFVIKLLAGHSVTVDLWGMVKLLSLVIYLPFILAQVVKFTNKKIIEKTSPYFKTSSMILLGFLIASVVAKQSQFIIEGINRGGDLIYYLIGLLVLFFILHILGYFLVFWRGREDKTTIAICVTYMNFTLAIELANKFFPEANVLLPVVFSVLPWALLLTPFGMLVNKKK